MIDARKSAVGSNWVETEGLVELSSMNMSWAMVLVSCRIGAVVESAYGPCRSQHGYWERDWQDLLGCPS
jgi:hypothetical protein